MTEMLKEQRIYSLDSIESWWLLLLTDGNLPFSYKWGQEIPVDTLYGSMDLETGGLHAIIMLGNKPIWEMSGYGFPDADS